jgi:hypothetical protein
MKIPEKNDRPKCPNCGKPLRPYTSHDYERINLEQGGFNHKRTRLEWDGRYDSYGAFCTLRCAAAFANDAYAAGYKRKG